MNNKNFFVSTHACTHTLTHTHTHTQLDTIANQFRTFPMEILRGEKNLIATVKESGCVFKFDFSQVYWNSRLQVSPHSLSLYFSVSLSSYFSLSLSISISLSLSLSYTLRRVSTRDSLSPSLPTASFGTFLQAWDPFPFPRQRAGVLCVRMI